MRVSILFTSQEASCPLDRCRTAVTGQHRLQVRRTMYLYQGCGSAVFFSWTWTWTRIRVQVQLKYKTKILEKKILMNIFGKTLLKFTLFITSKSKKRFLLMLVIFMKTKFAIFLQFLLQICPFFACWIRIRLQAAK